MSEVLFYLFLNIHNCVIISSSNEKQKQKVTDSNIEGTKKSSTKEMEQNERLEAIRMKIVGDVENLEQQSNQRQALPHTNKLKYFLNCIAQSKRRPENATNCSAKSTQ